MIEQARINVPKRRNNPQTPRCSNYVDEGGWKDDGQRTGGWGFVEICGLQW